MGLLRLQLITRKVVHAQAACVFETNHLSYSSERQSLEHESVCHSGNAGSSSVLVLISQTGTKATPAEQLSMALAWDRADIAQKEILVSGQHWQVSLICHRQVCFKKCTKKISSTPEMKLLLNQNSQTLIRLPPVVKLTDT